MDSISGVDTAFGQKCGRRAKKKLKQLSQEAERPVSLSYNFVTRNSGTISSTHCGIPGFPDVHNALQSSLRPGKIKGLLPVQIQERAIQPNSVLKSVTGEPWVFKDASPSLESKVPREPDEVDAVGFIVQFVGELSALSHGFKQPGNH
jgi:hypothetical protein